ncbi:hypothetical protein H072_3187 [Dactylellina haptotyla CBS 200.50]|uniref:Uncharacterized protein n=1 Tax=Dactylellina haptotyla (strain CBS 200.50) TaxID=1284197 RepID=S8C5D7_DACHA|nr:hypothetical protein H072_3187 [Dactylellina haptotyla CBS 200.50]
MVHFSIHQITSSLSPKNLRLRKRKSSNASSTVSDIVCSLSNVSLASSSVYRRRSIESITSTSTAASSAIIESGNDLGLTSPYYLPAKSLKPATKKSQLSKPKRTLTGNSITSSLNGGIMQLDMCGFHSVESADEEGFFVPELAVLEPRPDAHRFCGFEETLEQRSMMPFLL